MRMKMKKSIIAILIVMLLCSTSVFAATLDDGYYYGEPKVDDYLGLNVGASFVYETYEAASGKVVDKALQFYGGFSEFAFFGSAPLGIYFDAGVLVNIQDSYNPDAVNKSPAYADVMLGLAYKVDLESRSELILSFGPEFTYFTNEYTYIDGYEKVYVEKTYMTMGLTMGAEVLYRLGQDFYFSIGGKGSVMFLKWMTKEKSTWHGSTSESEIDDTEGYFGYRIVPKAGLYFKF